MPFDFFTVTIYQSALRRYQEQSLCARGDYRAGALRSTGATLSVASKARRGAGSADAADGRGGRPAMRASGIPRESGLSGSRRSQRRMVRSCGYEQGQPNGNEDCERLLYGRSSRRNGLAGGRGPGRRASPGRFAVSEWSRCSWS